MKGILLALLLVVVMSGVAWSYQAGGIMNVLLDPRSSRQHDGDDREWPDWPLVWRAFMSNPEIPREMQREVRTDREFRKDALAPGHGVHCRRRFIC